MVLKLTLVKSFEFPDVHVKDPARRTPVQFHRWASQTRRKVLLDLANTEDVGLDYFWKKWDWLFIPKESGADLLRLRDELRQVWIMDPQSSLILTLWLNWHQPAPSQPMWWVDRNLGLLLPNPSILRVALATGVMEVGSRFTKCDNPGCQHPYFLRSRRGQRVCDNRACVAFAVRKRKRQWWALHGNEWRRKRRAKLTRKKSKRGGK